MIPKRKKYLFTRVISVSYYYSVRIRNNTFLSLINNVKVIIVLVKKHLF